MATETGAAGRGGKCCDFLESYISLVKGDRWAPGPLQVVHIPTPFFRPPPKVVHGIKRDDILTDIVEIYRKVLPGRAEEGNSAIS